MADSYDVPNLVYTEYSVKVNGLSLFITQRWNQTHGAWMMDFSLKDSQEVEILLTGISMVGGVNFLEALPQFRGWVMTLSDSSFSLSDPGRADLEKGYKLVIFQP